MVVPRVIGTSDGRSFGRLDGPLLIAGVGGLAYAVGVLLWAVTTGVHVTTDGLRPTAVAVGYAGFGLFLLGAVPLYLLGRFALVSPAVIALWSLANTLYLRWFVPRPHDALASYLTVWPVFVGLLVAVAVVEGVSRALLHRQLGRFGPRRLG